MSDARATMIDSLSKAGMGMVALLILGYFLHVQSTQNAKYSQAQLDLFSKALEIDSKSYELNQATHRTLMELLEKQNELIDRQDLFKAIKEGSLPNPQN